MPNYIVTVELLVDTPNEDQAVNSVADLYLPDMEKKGYKALRDTRINDVREAKEKDIVARFRDSSE